MTGATNTDNPKPIREPFIAGVLSFFWMGLGQSYNGQRKKGYLFLVSIFVVVILYAILLQVFHESLPKSGEEAPHHSPSYMISVLVYFIIWVLNIYDAQSFARRINRGEITVTETAGRSALVFLRSVVLFFLALVVIYIVIIILLALLFKVPTVKP